MEFFAALLAAVVVFLIVSVLVWWLVPIAFPGLAFGFGNATALTAIGFLFSGLASVK